MKKGTCVHGSAYKYDGLQGPCYRCKEIDAAVAQHKVHKMEHRALRALYNACLRYEGSPTPYNESAIRATYNKVRLTLGRKVLK